MNRTAEWYFNEVVSLVSVSMGPTTVALIKDKMREMVVAARRQALEYERLTLLDNMQPQIDRLQKCVNNIPAGVDSAVVSGYDLNMLQDLLRAIKQEREAIVTARREALEAAIAVDNAILAALSKKGLAKAVKPTDCASQQINFDPNVKATGATVSTEPQPLEIKAGNYYRTRDGRKAFVAAVSLDNPFADCVDCCPVETYYGKTERQFLSREGKEVGNSDGPNDLVAEWHEPRQATYIVYMLQDDTVPGGVDLLVQSDYVPFHTSRTILARHKHTLIEGDGMSGTPAP